MVSPNSIAPVIVPRPAWMGLTSRRSVSKEDVKDAAKHIERDPSYAKNGWTPELLAMYFKERHEAQSNVVLHRRSVRPIRTNGWHNPHRWRR